MTAAEKELFKAMGRFITEGIDSLRSDMLRLADVRRQIDVEKLNDEQKKKFVEATDKLLNLKLYSINPLERYLA